MPDQAINAGIASGTSFEDRIGSPDTVTSAFGFVVLAFSSLEEVVSRAIVGVLGNDETAGNTVVAELSFERKLHLLASLVRLNPAGRHFLSSNQEPNAVLSELISRAFRAEELRNRLLHSTWLSVPLESDVMQRFKTTAKARRGLHTDIEFLDSAAILDVAEYIDQTAGALDVFFSPPVRVA